MTRLVLDQPPTNTGPWPLRCPLCEIDGQTDDKALADEFTKAHAP
ncbi:MAG TPA: hypothetical protein VHM23_28335 [Actinomycetota bacterium]|jgi:hypothetical protein|nr:hypothetical protein [Actinomycetota bacterium]